MWLDRVEAAGNGGFFLCAARRLRDLRDLCQMRTFLKFVGFPFVPLYADEMFFTGQFTQGAVKMFSEMAVWMHLTG
jgi:hypothetical protein